MTNVTRDVISDLWPLYLSGEVSADTRRLIEGFLAGDPELARTLREAGSDPLMACLPPALPPDHQMATLERVKRRLWGYPMLLQMAILFSCFAFGRIVADTSWDVSPRNFLITAAIAAVPWVAFFVTLLRGRRAFLVRLR
jgi:anti-sigma factor RsiW